jgi:hypothetical protein
MNIRLKIALFVITLVALLAFQSKLVMPMVYKVIASDAFLEDTDDVGSQIPVSTNMTHLAFKQCNDYIAKDLGENFAIVFPKEPINSWDVGNYEYMINADIKVTAKGATAVSKRYACNIKYKNKKDMTGASDADNWSVEGLSGLSDL